MNQFPLCALANLAGAWAKQNLRLIRQSNLSKPVNSSQPGMQLVRAGAGGRLAALQFALPGWPLAAVRAGFVGADAGGGAPLLQFAGMLPSEMGWEKGCYAGRPSVMTSRGCKSFSAPQAGRAGTAIILAEVGSTSRLRCAIAVRRRLVSVTVHCSPASRVTADGGPEYKYARDR